jgi:nitrous oxidase accessory protein NosD
MDDHSVKHPVCILLLGLASVPVPGQGEAFVVSAKAVEFRQGIAGQTVKQSVALTQDIHANGQTAIVLGADDVVLDCAGHTISGDGTGNGVESIDHKGVTITNCVIENFEKGVYLASTDGRKEELLSVANVVRDNTLTANQHGVFLMWSHQATISGNQLIGNTDSAISLTLRIGSSLPSAVRTCSSPVFLL